MGTAAAVCRGSTLPSVVGSALPVCVCRESQFMQCSIVGCTTDAKAAIPRE